MSTTYSVGDPDPTPDEGPYCLDRDGSFGCTWRSDHDGDHVAGDGDVIWRVWPNEAKPAEPLTVYVARAETGGDNDWQEVHATAESARRALAAFIDESLTIVYGEDPDPEDERPEVTTDNVEEVAEAEGWYATVDPHTVLNNQEA